MEHKGTIDCKNAVTLGLQHLPASRKAEDRARCKPELTCGHDPSAQPARTASAPQSQPMPSCATSGPHICTAKKPPLPS